MKRLLFYWWIMFIPVNVKVFYRAGCFDKDTFAGIWPASQTAFDRCSPLEQEFILWRDPVFKQYVSRKGEWQ